MMYRIYIFLLMLAQACHSSLAMLMHACRVCLYPQGQIFVLLVGVSLQSCNVSGPAGLFGKRSPHEKYGQNLIDAGLRESALGKAWFGQAEASLLKPLSVTIPYKESGYFSAEQPRAAAVRFEAKRGQRISISLDKKPATNFCIYVDLWEAKTSGNKKLLAYADTNAAPFKHDIDDNGIYILRLQPELLGSGEYTLTISSGPSLAFPVQKGKIGSFWGADRDGGVRRHEGVDIFAAKRTPALAAADGFVSRVGDNKLGGKVVFIRPEGKNYNLYYAHLDEQLVTDGQKVSAGDTIGLVGNTGNAINTAPHLHFGIYTGGGAIDPLDFINPAIKSPPAITASLTSIGKSVRTGSGIVHMREGPSATAASLRTLSLNSLLQVEAASSGWYKVLLPDGVSGFVSSTTVKPVSLPVKQLKISNEQYVLDKPESIAARKGVVSPGESIRILGEYNGYYYVSGSRHSGWLPKNL
ncbi:M23 family metallopeptidase [Desertivirga xinjiangensis]|uniref:M23 family metallopeptidase n=1 Tax=Desertivirga xinjiangensis TaxID=539206 RepID=UPI00210A753E|nr:M23 family metallopeptidase [Pedobacter xinjiangensis]